MMKDLWKLGRHLRSILADILFPESCAGCGTPDTALCSICKQHIPFIRESIPEPWIFPLSSYRDHTIKESISRAKYRGRPEALIELGPFLYDRILEATVEETHLTQTSWTLIPIPITHKRKKRRGYNQTEILGKAIIKHDTADMLTMNTTLLLRKQGTKSQVEIASRSARLNNPRGSFILRNPKYVHGTRCIILDDVVTTGATLREAKRVLKEAGAKEVLAVTVGYTELH